MHAPSTGGPMSGKAKLGRVTIPPRKMSVVEYGKF